MNRNLLPMRMIIAFGTLLGLYTAAMMVVYRFSEHAGAFESSAPWLLAGDEDSQLSLAYERMGQGDSASLSQSITMFTTLMARNPASPYRWCDLGEALLEAGDGQRARYCFSRAYEFGSHIAPILMRIANFHFRQGETRPAVEAMAKILTQVADYDEVIFSYYDRMGVNTADILSYASPGPVVFPAPP